jgi:hypothetical protein
MTIVEQVVIYTKEHPDTLQRDLALLFSLTQSRVSRIIRDAGLSKPWRSGRPNKRRDDQTNEQFKWETILHNAGLGMDRGMRINGNRIQYGYDPLLSKPEDRSITSN